MIAGSMLGILLGAFDGAVLSTALPSIARDLAGIQQLPWLASAFAFGTAVAAPIWGTAGDRHGHRRVMRIGLFILLVATILCAFAGLSPKVNGAVPPVLQLVVARLAQGIGSAAIFTATIADLAGRIPARRRARFAGGFSVVFALATVLAPLIGGVMADSTAWTLFGLPFQGWRLIFLVQPPIILLAILLVGSQTAAVNGKRSRFDGEGLALISLFLLGSAASIEMFRTEHMLGSLAMALVAMGAVAALPAIERRAVTPLLSPTFFEDPLVRRPMLAAACCSTALTGFAIAFPAHVQLCLGSSAVAAGTLMASFSIGIAAGAVLGGRMIGHTGRVRTVTIAAILLCLAALAVLANAATPAAMTFIVFLVGLGFGPLQTVHSLAVQQAVDYDRQGGAAGAFQFSRRVGATAGSAVGAMAIAEAALNQHGVETICVATTMTGWLPNAIPAMVCALPLCAALFLSLRMSREVLPEA